MPCSVGMVYLSDAREAVIMVQVTIPKSIRMTTTEKQVAMLELSRLHGDYCSICGSKDDLTIDHINPQSNGGSNAIHNLQILCRRCNSRKNDWCLNGAYRASKHLTDEQIERDLDRYERFLAERATQETRQGISGIAAQELHEFLETRYQYEVTELAQSSDCIPF